MNTAAPVNIDFAKTLSWINGRTADKITLIRAVYQRGISSTQIAAEVSALTRTYVSRNAVIGIYDRHGDKMADIPLLRRAVAAQRAKGCAPRSKPPSAPKMQRPPAKPSSAATPKPKSSADRRIAFFRTKQPVIERPTMAMATLFDQNSRKLTLMQLGPRECKWPVNNFARGETALYCGHVQAFKSPYCDHHLARSMSRAVAETEEGAPA